MEVPAVTTTPTSSGPSASTILLLSKIGSMFVLGLGSLILGMLPLIIGRCRVKKSENRRAITSVSSASTTLTSASTLTVNSHADFSQPQQGLLTSLLLCFGGGVLLFTTFLHLAPEVRESVELHQSNGQLVNLGSLSLAELLFCGGFFFVYLVEEAVHAALSDKPESSETLLYRTVSVRRCNNGTQAGSANGAGRRPSQALSGVFPLSSSASTIERPRPRELAPEHKHLPTASATHVDSSVRSLLTVLALSFHAIFEGLAVGLEPAFGSVVYLAAAIATHKLVISFCVGMELYVAGASKRTILGYLSVFSMVTPLGIGVGLALGHLRNDSETLGPTPTILQGMAAGTLLYVVFFEVLARERANDKSGLLQLVAILVGFMLMLGLQIATAHSHDHGHSHGSHNHGDHNHGDHEDAHLVGDKHNYILGSTIERVTDKVADVLSTTLT
ncbi:PREDICTED: zinc transporter ZIP2-like [Ceratosolen solmsi marchali]|uniref:Zinc transporter ZIP2-like n=1 Tax=Ceratosolen solmsi marchali TaxID=326594 RepID=A0AAJ6YGY6_9HYME|nr:PREDICTED: zinc transporter ZIP2-like [Ceratosolen solmsi marchali]XP_011497846.1 PREDICTED: zinc transporter ZIP2-like [Ceratosolen solmsi marchali]XP_011497847.1 PREDICTED: zinc transporter ZIP2-like [Ceratosolen solmsi marchali]